MLAFLGLGPSGSDVLLANNLRELQSGLLQQHPLTTSRAHFRGPVDPFQVQVQVCSVSTDIKIVPDSIFMVPCIRTETQASRGGMLEEKHGEGSVHEVQKKTKMDKNNLSLHARGRLSAKT